jgi:putative peptidoglycan lipid II flippase
LTRAETRGFTALAVPALIASGIPQLTMIVAAVIASDWPGAVAYLYYANRLIDLPLGMVGIAVGTVMTPALSHAVRSDDHEIAPRTIQRGIELSLGLALPAAIGLFVLGWPIVRILFERGAFTSVDSRSTSAMLAAFAIGLPGHVLVKTLSPVFFAREDTRTPMLITLAGLALAVIGSIAFMRIGRPTGIAFSIAVSGWFAAALLYALARRRRLMDAAAISWRRLGLIALAAILTGILAGIFGHYLGLYGPEYHLQTFHAVILAVVIAFAIAFYLSCLWLFGVIRAGDLQNA